MAAAAKAAAAIKAASIAGERLLPKPNGVAQVLVKSEGKFDCLKSKIFF